jgi:hypothetical protein
MLRSALQLKGYHIAATDGEIGKARDLFFDDALWTVRYLVVDTGTWLPGRRVLISPAALGRPDWKENAFPVNLTRKQVENSPGVASDRPVSRQLEADIVDYFNWPIYWGPALFAAQSMAGGNPPPPIAPDAEERLRERVSKNDSADADLRSVREICGYHVSARNGDIGHVEDLILDDETWLIRYIVVDTHNWLPGRKVLLAPDWFFDFNWREAKAYTELSKAAIKDSPDYNPSQPINRDYEGELYDYYGRPAYWNLVAGAGLGWKI